MLLNTYSPEMAPIVRGVVQKSYPEVIRCAKREFPAADSALLVCGQPVCDIASRVVVERLLASGIAAYREEHPKHFVTVLAAEQPRATATDMIICLTWAQWGALYTEGATVEDLVAKHASVGQPGYFGPREDIQSWLPEGIYDQEYSPESVTSLAGAFNLKPLDPPVDGFAFEWDMSQGVTRTVEASSRPASS